MEPGKVLFSSATFLSKHTLASAVCIAGFTAFCTLAYYTLVFISVLFTGDMGGPLNFIIIPLLALVFILAGTVLVLFPVTVLSDWLCRSQLRLRFLFQIPIAVGLMEMQILLLLSLNKMLNAPGTSWGVVLWQCAIFTILLVGPLGAYWWCLKTHDGIVFVLGKGIGYVRYLMGKGPNTLFDSGMDEESLSPTGRYRP